MDKKKIIAIVVAVVIVTVVVVIANINKSQNETTKETTTTQPTTTTTQPTTTTIQPTTTQPISATATKKETTTKQETSSTTKKETDTKQENTLKNSEINWIINTWFKNLGEYGAIDGYDILEMPYKYPGSYEITGLTKDNYKNKIYEIIDNEDFMYKYSNNCISCFYYFEDNGNSTTLYFNSVVKNKPSHSIEKTSE